MKIVGRLFILWLMIAGQDVLARGASVFDTIKKNSIIPEKAKIEGLDASQYVEGSYVPIEGDESKLVMTRSDHLQRGESCTLCHAKGQSEGHRSHKKAHWDILLVHPNEKTSCDTCHDQDARYLKLNDGTRIVFDEVYTLCAQCHFEQKRDWIRGAHGKRMGGWNGTNIKENCTGCHDPHSPKFSKRRPAIHVTLPEK